MNFRQEILEERNKKLKINEPDTENVFNTILKAYKEKIINAPKNISNYTISIVFCNINGFNRLGKTDELIKNWGDIYFIDFNNSSFLINEINDEGSEEVTDTIEFLDINNLTTIKDIPFSMKELISLCKTNDFKIVIYSNNYDDEKSTIEIFISKPYEDNTSIKNYLNC